MSEYLFAQEEQRWQAYWEEKGIYRTPDDPNLPTYYVLDMFPYPSGAGLHVGHPLGYIASDIMARYHRMRGYAVLHPMGFDAFGLPAEQYAIQTGQHPAHTTADNIKKYTEQLRKIGFSYDWSRSVTTSDPSYYRWTQWIFLELFNSWYDRDAHNGVGRARPIHELIRHFEMRGTYELHAACADDTPVFTADEWKLYTEAERSEQLMHYRLAYLAEAQVNWCPALGTVLANDEVKDGVSERGGHPVEVRMMQQWMLRITAYSARLLDGLNDLNWSDAIKEQQRHWIGRSTGARIRFKPETLETHHQTHTLETHITLSSTEEEPIEVFTTRPDTLFGVSFLVLAPEHPRVMALTHPTRRREVERYVLQTQLRSERERMAEVKTVSGVPTGRHAVNPLNSARIPIWIADYVLAGYGVGAVMGVPGSDERDWRFAQHFKLPIIPVVEGTNPEKGAESQRSARMINSDFLDGHTADEAIPLVIERLEQLGHGEGTTQYRLRDAIFSRQRYWGEPVPIAFGDHGPVAVDTSDLPLLLPEVDKYLPTEEGEPPLARAKDWSYHRMPLETTTMPGWAGSSWYFLRYTDPHNTKEFASRIHTDRWKQVDLYMGGAEHATGHLLYARFWTQFLYDRGHIGFNEPFRCLVNQGMIQGVSAYMQRVRLPGIKPDENHQTRVLKGFNKNGAPLRWECPSTYTNAWLSAGIQIEGAEPSGRVSVDVSLVEQNRLNCTEWKAQETGRDTQGWLMIGENGHLTAQSQSHNELHSDELIFYTSPEVEKMSKSKRNVVNPDWVVKKYGADTLRMYEMFLGPLEVSKPWDTQGIEGVFRFLQKLWRMCHPGGQFSLDQGEPTDQEWKSLHKLLLKIGSDIERFSFNTSVSAFMIAVNELQTMGCHKQAIIDPLVRALAPFAPHLSESLWQAMGKPESVHLSAFPEGDPERVREDNYDYPIQENGKMRFNLNLPRAASAEELQALVMANPRVHQLCGERKPKRVVVVPGRIVNLVF
ncbi:MAG: leucine--tRNA ligase [Sphingomonadales bacterium]|nr:leucine--tRNA ligase [Sphingomonadales bacterium]